MGKKYLSIEEAARLLGMDPKQLNRMREKGEVLAFADRGTWKFRQDEIEELSRMQLPDSNPEVPLGNYTKAGDLSDEIVLGNEDEALSDQPTIIRRTPIDSDEQDSEARIMINEKFQPNYNSSGALPRPDVSELGSEPLGEPAGSGVNLDSPRAKPGPGSDSDVRLVFDESVMGSGSSADIPVLPGEDSVSDVRLQLDEGSDSDIKLVTDDSMSDVRTPSPSLDRSDSDVKLMLPKQPGEGSDSDVQLITPRKRPKAVEHSADGTESDVVSANAGQDDADVFSLDMVPQDDEGSFVLGGKDSGIFSAGPSDSGIALDFDAGTSGANLEGDSGITLAGESVDGGADGDSGISLDTMGAFSIEDSGISLADESGFLLSGPESGISLESPDAQTKQLPPNKKSGSTAKARKPSPAGDDDELAGTIPMMPALAGGDDESFADTQMEVPMLGGEDSDFEFSSNALDDDSTNVIMLDDEGGVDDYGATMVKKRGAPTEEVFDETGDEVFDVEESSESGAYAVDADDDLEVADDLIGEDDELEEDVFDADDDAFDDDLQTGQSHADFVAPVGRMAAPVEQEWGAGMVAGLSISTLVMCATGWVMYDLVRTIWTGNDPTGPTDAMLGMFRGFFG